MLNGLCQLSAAFIMGLSSVYFFRQKRIGGILPFISSFTYLIMFFEPTKIEIYRHVEWAITTPIILWFLLANTNIVDHTYGGLVMILDIKMIYLGYLYVITANRLFFMLACVCYLPIFTTFVLALIKAQSRNTRTAIMFIMTIWSLYPIIQYFAIFIDHRISYYAIMDTTTKIGVVSLLSI